MLIFWFEQHGTQCRRECQGIQCRDTHRYRHRDSELRIEDTRGASHKRYRNKHRHKDERTGDNRRGDTLHRIDRSLIWRLIAQIEFRMYGLHHDNRIIDHHTDREHQRKEGEEVNTEIEDKEKEECSNNRHYGTDKRYHRRAEISQEEEYNECYQHDSLQECSHHIVDRGEEEVVGTLQDDHIQIDREILTSLFEECVNLLDHLGSIRVGRLVDDKLRTRRTVDLAQVLVRLCSELDICDIFQSQHLAIRQGSDYDILELVGLLQSTPISHSILEGLVGILSKRTGCRLDILLAQRLRDIGRYQLILRHNIGFEPDTHRVVRASHIYIAHTRNTGDGWHKVNLDIVHDKGTVVRAIRAVQRHSLQDTRLSLLDGNTRLNNLRRELSGGTRYAVLHIDRCHIGIGTLLEVDCYRAATIVGRRRGHIGHILHSVDSLFEWHEGTLLHGLGTRSRIGYRHKDCRRSDTWISLNRKYRQSDKSADDNHYRDYGREYRTIYKGFDIHLSFLLVLGLLLLFLWSYELLDFDRGVVTQKTDTLNNDSIACHKTRLDDILLAIANLEYANDFSLGDAILDLVGIDLVLHLEGGVLRNNNTTLLTVWEDDCSRTTRKKKAFLVRELGTNGYRTCRRVDNTRDGLDASLLRIDRTIAQLQIDHRHLLQSIFESAILAFERQHLTLAQREIDIHLRVVRYGGHRCCVRRAHERSYTEWECSDNAIYRTLHERIGEVVARRKFVGTSLCKLRLGTRQCCASHTEVEVGDDILLEQLLFTCCREFGSIDLSLCYIDICLCRSEGSLIRDLVDHEECLTLTDNRTLLNLDVGDIALHLRADIDILLSSNRCRIGRTEFAGRGVENHRIVLTNALCLGGLLLTTCK